MPPKGYPTYSIEKPSRKRSQGDNFVSSNEVPSPFRMAPRLGGISTYEFFKNSLSSISTFLIRLILYNQLRNLLPQDGALVVVKSLEVYSQIEIDLFGYIDFVTL